MGISVEATEAKATALIAKCRSALAQGSSIRGQYLKDIIAQLESATVNDLSGRTDVLADNFNDGRNADEATAIA